MIKSFFGFLHIQWKESIGIVTPFSNFKLFVKGWLHLALSLYNNSINIFNLNVIMSVTLLLCKINTADAYKHLMYTLMIIGVVSAKYLEAFLSIRPSVVNKFDRFFYFNYYNKAYIQGYLYHITILLCILMSSVFFIKSIFFSGFGMENPVVFLCASLYCSINSWFILFFYDVRLTFKNFVLSMVRNAKMIWYNLPIFFILFLISTAIHYALYLIVSYAKLYYSPLSVLGITVGGLLIVIPLIIAPWIFVYIKRVNSTRSLYFVK